MRSAKILSVCMVMAVGCGSNSGDSTGPTGADPQLATATTKAALAVAPAGTVSVATGGDFRTDFDVPASARSLVRTQRLTRRASAALPSGDSLPKIKFRQPTQAQVSADLTTLSERVFVKARGLFPSLKAENPRVVGNGLLRLDLPEPAIAYGVLASGMANFRYPAVFEHETVIPNAESAVSGALAAIADASLVTLGSNEGLDLLGIQSIHHATVNDDGVKEHKTVGYHVTFGRTYRGVPILGATSSVVLDADGRMAHFRKGWRDIVGEQGAVRLAPASKVQSRRDALMVQYLVEKDVSCGYTEDSNGNTTQPVAGIGCRFTHEDPLASEPMDKVKEEWVSVVDDDSIPLFGNRAPVKQ
jgi:hypothetical protein